MRLERDGDGVRIADRAGARPARHGAAEAHRQRVHRLRARRLHDAPRPRATGRSTSASTWAGATPTRPTPSAPTRRATSPPSRCATSARRSSTSFVSESIQHLVHAMGDAAAGALPRARGGLVRRAQHDPRPGGGGRLHRPLPGPGDDHPRDAPVSGPASPPTCSTRRAGRPAAGRPASRCGATGEVVAEAVTERRRAHRRPPARGRRPHRRACTSSTFAVGAYFGGDGGFLDEVPVRFTVTDARRAPTTCRCWSPPGPTRTYRGS